MESYFDIMAKHPNCLLAVDATDGGKWKSNFHVPQLINFQTHRKIWTNFNANFNTDSGIKYTDDFEFEIDFEWNLTPEEFINNNKAMSVFYGGVSTVPIGIYMYADSRIGIWTVCRKNKSTGKVSPIGSVESISLSKGEHNLKLKYSYSKTTQEVIIDDNILYSIPLYNSALTLIDFITSNNPSSNFDGGFYSATLTKTTDGARTKVWEAQKNEIRTNLPIMPTAPTGSGSFEETHGLLTKRNVEAENNYFKHTTTDIGYIETPLDLRGYAGDFTMISKAYIPSAGKAFTFFVQNNNRSRSSRFYYNDNNSNMVLLLNNSSDVRKIHSSTALALDRTIPHVFAVTVSQKEKKVTFYIDGVLKNATPLSSDFDYFSNTKASGFSNVQIMQSNFANDGPFSYDFEGKLFASLFFNKELTADDIKILSDSMTEKKVEYASDDLLCTTPTNLTSNTSNADWECYTEPISNGTNAHSDTAYMAAAGFTGYDLNTANGRWAADKGTALTDTSAGVRFVWKRTDLAEWAVKRVILGNHWKSVFPQRIQHFILQGSNDGTTWTNIGEKQESTVNANVYSEQTFDYLSNTEKYKYWAINCNYDLTWTDAAYTQLSAAANKIQFTNEI